MSISGDLRKFLTMEDHPGDVALLEAIEMAADEIDRLRAENERLRETLNIIHGHTINAVDGRSAEMAIGAITVVVRAILA